MYSDDFNFLILRRCYCVDLKLYNINFYLYPTTFNFDYNNMSKNTIFDSILFIKHFWRYTALCNNNVGHIHILIYMFYDNWCYRVIRRNWYFSFVYYSGCKHVWDLLLHTNCYIWKNIKFPVVYIHIQAVKHTTLLSVSTKFDGQRS